MHKTMLHTWEDKWPEIRSTQPLPITEAVIDQAGFKTIEVEELFNTVNEAVTTVGQAVLYRSLTQPLTSLQHINSKQEALREIQEDSELKESLTTFVNNAAESENNFYLLLFGEFLGALGSAREEHQIEGFGYLQYTRGIRFMLGLVAQTKEQKLPKSSYLKDIFEKISRFGDSRAYALMNGPVYISEQGIQSKADRSGSFSPAVIFRPTLFKPLLITLVLGGIWLFLSMFPTDMFNFSTKSIPVVSVLLFPLLLIYIPIVGGFDRDKAIIPLRNIFKQSEELAEALDAFGQLDELISLIKFSESYGSAMVLPELITAENHKLKLVDAKNPVLGKANSNYVGNDIVLDKDRLIFITGPNSGGKTAFCKTVTQIQLLAQIGCFVPASSAILTVADTISYQAPEMSHLDDGEGRFGTELKRTKDIFLNCTAQSLVVLDELSEGTTFEEKMATSINVLDGFHEIGCSTLLITHNHQLVDYFINKGIGLARQVEFAGDAPSYKLIPGISRVSHADRIAKKIGFAKVDIAKYLKKNLK
jgi:hypothetical protein